VRFGNDGQVSLQAKDAPACIPSGQCLVVGVVCMSDLAAVAVCGIYEQLGARCLKGNQICWLRGETQAKLTLHSL